jgi:hypothetical protein
LLEEGRKSSSADKLSEVEDKKIKVEDNLKEPADKLRKLEYKK